MSKRILVIGDACRDVFINVDTPRLSPESPVPVIVPHSVLENPGMAANVALNIQSLAPEYLVATRFPDDVSVKTRYVDRKTNHHFLRVDQDVLVEPLQHNDILRAFMAKPDAIVVSDYAKGYLNDRNIEYLVGYWRREVDEIVSQFFPEVPIFLDTKAILGHWSRCIDFVKINDLEFNNQLKAGVNPWEHCRNLLVTRGRNGIDLYDSTGNVVYNSAAVNLNVQVADTAGAGDTTLAALVVRYLETGDIRQSMDWANKAAAVAVSKRGVVAVKREEIV